MPRSPFSAEAFQPWVVRMAVNVGRWRFTRSGAVGGVPGLAGVRSGLRGTRHESARRFGSTTFPVGNTVAEERRVCPRRGFAVGLGERLRLAGGLWRPAEGFSERGVGRDAQRSTRETAANLGVRVKSSSGVADSGTGRRALPATRRISAGSHGSFGESCWFRHLFVREAFSTDSSFYLKSPPIFLLTTFFSRDRT